ncbi:MAG: ribonuclease H-like domain-containing protein [Candidatus Paceibacterota bacterium]|jgi:DEAD/DEAH box helicase domain-containing protein
MKKVVFDIETKNIFQDVGRADPVLLDISVVCIYDYDTDQYLSFLEEDLPKLWPYIEQADILIGYNSDHFDIPLLNKYYPGDLTKIKSIDLMAEIKKSLGRRIGLGAVAEATLGYGKSGNGLEAVTWWKEGKIDEIIKYCIADVKVTKELYEHMKNKKNIRYKDGNDLRVLNIDTKEWDKEEDAGMNFSMGF